MSHVEIGDHIKASIHIGGVWASRKPSVVRTVLGSCIAVCLRDPIARVGGMNHFMLPDAGNDEDLSSRYGVNAMEVLINRCMQEGADRYRLEAKVFGGGHVLRTANHADSVPQKNIHFALKFLQVEQIPIVSKDIGGFSARSILFFTDSGKILLKRLRETGADADKLAKIEKLEEKVASTPKPKDEDDNVTLF